MIEGADILIMIIMTISVAVKKSNHEHIWDKSKYTQLLRSNKTICGSGDRLLINQLIAAAIHNLIIIIVVAFERTKREHILDKSQIYNQPIKPHTFGQSLSLSDLIDSRTQENS